MNSAWIQHHSDLNYCRKLLKIQGENEISMKSAWNQHEFSIYMWNNLLTPSQWCWIHAEFMLNSCWFHADFIFTLNFEKLSTVVEIRMVLNSCWIHAEFMLISCWFHFHLEFWKALYSNWDQNGVEFMLNSCWIHAEFKQNHEKHLHLPNTIAFQAS